MVSADRRATEAKDELQTDIGFLGDLRKKFRCLIVVPNPVNVSGTSDNTS